MSRVQRLGFVLGLRGCGVLLLLPAPAGLGAAGFRPAAVRWLLRLRWGAEREGEGVARGGGSSGIEADRLSPAP